MTLNAICLRTIRHSDTQSILTLWTDRAGRVTVSVPAGNSPAARRLRALTQPLGLIETELDIRPTRNIQSIKDVRPISCSTQISADPVKNISALFIADLLETCLRNNEPDKLMTDFIIDSIASLDCMSHTAALNFIPYFMLRFTHFLGIEPDWSEPGDIFDLQEGQFRDSIPLHSDYLIGTNVRALRQLARINHRNLGRYRFTRSERTIILNRLLTYYSIHHRPVNTLPSFAILSTL